MSILTAMSLTSSVALLGCILSLSPSALAQPAAGGASAPNVDVLQRRVRRLESEIQRRDLRARSAVKRRQARRERNLRIYRQAHARYQSTVRNYPPEHPEVARAETSFIDAAWAAYVVAERDQRRTIRKQLFVTEAGSMDERSLFEVVESYIQGSGAKAERLEGVLGDLHDKTELARTLAMPAHQASVQRLLKEIHERYPEELPAGIPAPSDFGSAFETLSSLDSEAYRFAAQRAAELFGLADPQTHLVRERLVVAHVIDSAFAPSYANAFGKAFNAWMKEATPDHEIRERRLAARQWNERNVKDLIARTHGLLTAQPPALPACPDAEQTNEQTSDALLCPPMYHGLVVLELRATPRGPFAQVSWRVRESGLQLNRGDAFRADNFEISLQGTSGEGRLKGGELAVRVLKEGTIYKEVQGILSLLKDMPPEQLAAVLRDRRSDIRSEVESAPFPPSSGGPASAATALAWAGAPWLWDETSANDPIGYGLGTLDAVALAGSVAVFAVALGRQASGARADNGWMTAGAASLGVVLSSRLLSGLAYAIMSGRPERNPALALEGGLRYGL